MAEMGARRRFQVFIPGELPARNDSEAAARGNKFAAAGLKHKYTKRVAMAVMRARDVAWVPLSRFSLAVEFKCKNRRKDPDNILGGLKYLLDGLVAGGLVSGDRWANVLGIVPSWSVDKDNPGVLVTIEGD